MGSDLLWRTDSHLRDAVQYQLECEPDINPADIGVNATDGLITLVGSVRTFPEKLAAERAARRVYGVKHLANDIQVIPESEQSDAEIARDAAEALRAQTFVPTEVSVTVMQGFVTIEGPVDRLFQRRAAEACVKYLRGVRGVSNQIEVRSR
jgi:osmotically-inducible protein OsmY